jgi:hypothetical protein
LNVRNQAKFGVLTSRRPPVMRCSSMRFKTEFLDQDAATQAALELLAKYPMLKIEIYDAASKSRTPAK